MTLAMCWIGVDGIVDQCEYQSIDKVVFKQPVIPGDALYIHIVCPDLDEA